MVSVSRVHTQFAFTRFVCSVLLLHQGNVVTGQHSFSLHPLISVAQLVVKSAFKNSTCQEVVPLRSFKNGRRADAHHVGPL